MSLLLLCLLVLPSPAWAQEPAGVEVPTAREVAREGLLRARAWLIDAQNEDGSWGHWRRPESAGWSNPATHRSWQVATTALGCMALLDAGVAPRGAAPEAWVALLRGIDFLSERAAVKRPSDWDLDNTWAYVYGLAALTQAAGDERFAGAEHAERRAAMRAMGERLLDKLWQYQTPSGGWAYYADESRARRPWWATSFQTAVAVLGLLDARSLGWRIDEERLARAVKTVARCRLPSGAYTYSVELFPSPGGLENIDQVNGSLGRIQVCNLALYAAAQHGYETGIAVEELREGLRLFFRHHRFLDVARRRPIPHEAYYYNSGYFYFFGHYYAARVIEALPAGEREPWSMQLWSEVLKTQATDGSMWDFYMNDYGKPYGVAFGISCLARTTRPAPRAPDPAGSR